MRAGSVISRNFNESSCLVEGRPAVAVVAVRGRAAGVIEQQARQARQAARAEPVAPEPEGRECAARAVDRERAVSDYSSVVFFVFLAARMRHVCGRASDETAVGPGGPARLAAR